VSQNTKFPVVWLLEFRLLEREAPCPHPKINYNPGNASETGKFMLCSTQPYDTIAQTNQRKGRPHVSGWLKAKGKASIQCSTNPSRLILIRIMHQPDHQPISKGIRGSSNALKNSRDSFKATEL